MVDIIVVRIRIGDDGTKALDEIRFGTDKGIPRYQHSDAQQTKNGRYQELVMVVVYWTDHTITFTVTMAVAAAVAVAVAVAAVVEKRQ